MLIGFSTLTFSCCYSFRIQALISLSKSISPQLRKTPRGLSSSHMMTSSSNKHFDSPIDTSSVGFADIVKSNDDETFIGEDQDKLISWRRRINTSIKKSRKLRGGNYVQIATIDTSTQEPRCRTVVFRGFQPIRDNQSTDDSYIMKMITDARSSKVSEVGMDTFTSSSWEKNTVELVWWFSQSSEQYRIRGKLQYISDDESQDPFLRRARIEQWGNLSESAREQFFWDKPGIPFQESNKVMVPQGGRDEQGKLLPAPKTFLLMLLYPQRCDYLRLTDNYRQIDTFHYDEDQTWHSVRVNP